MKRVLVVYYSQSGQLGDILRAMLEPLSNAADVDLTWWELKPTPPYPFPWPLMRFLDVFPESVLMVPPQLEPLPESPPGGFDLVVLAYQVWYLAPSLPVSAFLQSPAARILRDRPVITVVNGRDKWVMAQECVKAALVERGARLIDNVAFVHGGNAVQNLVSTLRWLWTGRKGAFWKVFPVAGVSEQDLRGAVRFGQAIRQALARDAERTGEPMLRGLGAAHVNADMLLQERIAVRQFRVWARWVRAAGAPGAFGRRFVLLAFAVYLVGLILIAAPLVLVHRLLVVPLSSERLARDKACYEAPSGGE